MGYQFFPMRAKVLKFKTQVGQFFQGLTTNVLAAPQNAFLEVNGKTIAAFYQFNHEPDDSTLIVLHEKVSKNLQEKLQPFIKLSKTTVEETDYQAYFSLDASTPTGPDDRVIKLDHGSILITQREITDLVDTPSFDLFRLKTYQPLQGIDFADEMILNISASYVSFTKGCYRGQEVISRIHHLGRPPKKLIVQYLDQCTDSEKSLLTSITEDPQTRRQFGFLLVANRENPSL